MFISKRFFYFKRHDILPELIFTSEFSLQCQLKSLAPARNEKQTSKFATRALRRSEGCKRTARPSDHRNLDRHLPRRSGSWKLGENRPLSSPNSPWRLRASGCRPEDRWIYSHATESHLPKIVKAIQCHCISNIWIMWLSSCWGAFVYKQSEFECLEHPEVALIQY